MTRHRGSRLAAPDTCLIRVAVPISGIENIRFTGDFWKDPQVGMTLPIT